MKKIMAFTVVTVAAVGLLGLLGWALAKAQGTSFGGFAINADFTEVPVANPTPANFTLKLLSGEQITLEALKGKPLMIDFWASWCVPCRQEAPQLARLDKEYREKGVVFLGVTLWDSDSAARQFVERYGIQYANGIDQQGTIAIDFGVTGIPEKYFFNREGRVIRKFIGPVGEDKLREALDSLLASP